ncbi:asparagine synthetase B [Metabacillus litoralis]|uniref:asparagine synthase (glutamine-hydrolyzing) n=1 Tax=Metabacillus litoralis TaxID=152268 RepID=A0A5C6W4P9_9BACI|nr:asparagine synthase-related protein [Metabacillus litoralis]TXC92355.1 asparagine synthetase B [Metabacillus litoralis]
MSAIAGIFHLNKEPVSIEHINSMMGNLRRFPANDVQTWKKENIFLGCHAQWITPESLNKQLPFYDHERQIAITADAIIDNREELFSHLNIEKSIGVVIPDSQLILLAYQKWGEDCPKYLIGDFAFMIWDNKNQKLFGARDPSGYRTLYYYNDTTKFAFCTTIKSLLALPFIEKKLNESWLAEYIAISGMIDTVDASTTPYQNIKQIPPFHSVTVSRDFLKLNKYGQFNPGKTLKLKSDQEYIDAFQDVFQKAVKSRLRTHRNIGSHLSGGLDSGSVVGFAARELKHQNKLLHTFSYIPPSDFIDYTSKHLMPNESPYIKKTVDYVGGVSDHYYSFDGVDSYSELNDILDMNEMPYKFFENSFWLKGIFEKAHLEGIGVLLNGDNGNLSISWGNAFYYYSFLLKKLRWISLAKELNQYSENAGGSRFRNLPVIAKMAFPRISRPFSKNSMYRPLVINKEFANQIGIFHKLKQFGLNESGWFSGNNLNKHRRMVYDEIYPWNAGNTFNTKLSLQYSLWKRDPTNDIRVVKFCLSLPDEQFVQKGMDRALIRRSTENILPDEIRLNQKVRGIQAADWVHRIVPHWGELIEEMRELSEDERILKYFNKEIIDQALRKAKEGPQRENISNYDYRNLTQSLMLYRFIKNNF